MIACAAPQNCVDARPQLVCTHDRALLAFDTATEHLSIALAVHGRVWTHEAAGGAQASARLIPAILALLAQAGVTLRELDAIAFGRGPGAFTGLRTACSVAQGLAFGAGKRVLPIDSLLAVAEDARGRDSEHHVSGSTMDARMDEIYAAQYVPAHGAGRCSTAPMLTTPAALNERWQAQPPQLVAGSALAAFGERLRIGAAACAPDALPRAAAMLPLARALWAQGGAVDAALALPLYLRDKVAQTTLERDAAARARQKRPDERAVATMRACERSAAAASPMTTGAARCGDGDRGRPTLFRGAAATSSIRSRPATRRACCWTRAVRCSATSSRWPASTRCTCSTSPSHRPRRGRATRAS